MPKRKKTTLFKKSKAVKEPKMQSFKVSHKDLPFFTLAMTKQTLYWAVLMVVILLLEIWILYAQMSVIDAILA